MNRFSAFLTHFGISLVIFLIIGYVILYHWYPGLFFASDGGWQGIRIVALVDLVLGPTLTLCVFKAGKPGLKMDLTLIGIFQAICLAMGVFVVHAERPIAIVYSDGFFHSMTAEDYREVGFQVPDFGHLPGSTPKWVTSQLPSDPYKEYEIRKEALTEDIPLRSYAQFYKAFEGSDIDAARDSYSLEDLQEERSAELNRFLHEHGGTADDYLYLPFGARYQYAMIVMRKSDRSIAGSMVLNMVPAETG